MTERNNLGIYLTRVDFAAGDPDVLWATRDSDDETGELSTIVEVWCERPVRTTASNGAGAIWYPSSVDGEGLLGRYTLEAVQKWIGAAAPATDRECVCVCR